MPTARRPTFGGGYGVPSGDDGMLPWSWAAERLAQAHNYWIAVNGPHASPVWALWRDGAIVFSCGPRSRKARAIARDPNVVVHLESGDEVVIVEGRAEKTEVDDSVIDEYERKYAFRADKGEGWYRVEPQRVLAWTERDFPRNATRFDF
ncbi:MAG: pyridoxamine 5'-phosphate oxidase family protein [Actinobacteria bacterium]|nr:pyridoxamine 5'-phosphate oxidase family protein [Actinomycetota bacterium]MBV8480590.1 pyridoxamine 5'-phosphate oxidase family protein [Actinomycetota bacterium]